MSRIIFLCLINKLILLSKQSQIEKLNLYLQLFFKEFQLRRNILKKVLQNKIDYGILNVTEELFERYQRVSRFQEDIRIVPLQKLPKPSLISLKN